MNKAFAFAAAALVGVAGSVFAPLATRAADAPIKIGVNLELSGNASLWGQPQLNSIQMIVDRINKSGGVKGRALQLDVLDNKSDPSQSLLNVKQLIGDDVVAIIGGGTTPTTMPAVPVAESGQVPMIAVAGSNAIIEPPADRKWIFKSPSNDSVSAAVIASALKKLGFTSVGFLSVNNAYGASGLREFGAAADKDGIKIVDEEKYNSGDADMSSQLTKLKGTDAKAIVVWGIPPAVAIVAKNAAALSVPQKMIYSPGAAGNAFFALAGSALGGSYIAASKIIAVDDLPKNDPQRALLTSYIQEYKAKFHADPDEIAAYAADAIRLLDQAMTLGGTDRNSIRDGLEKIDNFPSFSGNYTITSTDHQGLSATAIVIAMNRDGHWSLVK